MALLRSCLMLQRLREGSAPEDFDFPSAGQLIEQVAASHVDASRDAGVRADSSEAREAREPNPLQAFASG